MTRILQPRCWLSSDNHLRVLMLYKPSVPPEPKSRGFLHLSVHSANSPYLLDMTPIPTTGFSHHGYFGLDKFFSFNRLETVP